MLDWKIIPKDKQTGNTQTHKNTEGVDKQTYTPTEHRVEDGNTNTAWSKTQTQTHTTRHKHKHTPPDRWSAPEIQAFLFSLYATQSGFISLSLSDWVSNELWQDTVCKIENNLEVGVGGREPP